LKGTLKNTDLFDGGSFRSNNKATPNQNMKHLEYSKDFWILRGRKTEKELKAVQNRKIDEREFDEEQ
jgi:hypothetical protein